MFTHPLLASQLPESVNSLKNQIKSYTLRYKDRQGVQNYLIGFRDLSQSNADIADNSAISASMPGVKYGKGIGKINGYVQLILQLNRAQYEELNRSPNIAVIDVTPAYIAMQSGVLEEMEQTGLTLPYAPFDPAADE